MELSKPVSLLAGFANELVYRISLRAGKALPSHCVSIIYTNRFI